jgi:enoyl-[acyl-carrier protein] reductase II
MGKQKITELFGIQYPIVQAGMIWCSGWKLAAAASNAGALGLIGAGSMRPDVLKEHILKCKENTQNPFGVNIPLLYPYTEAHMKTILDLGVKIVFTSAGSPKTWTKTLQSNGAKVVHVVSSTQFALKSEDAGVDAIVAEGFEAGGHNGREETTTLCLIPPVSDAVKIPVIAAGGIASGRAMAAAIALGAQGVQVGTRFAACLESSAHQNFKDKIRSVTEGDTILTLKELTPVRLIKNDFYQKIADAYAQNADKETLAKILGKGRSRIGMFEGDLNEGELEIGQIAATLRTVESAADVVMSIISEYRDTLQNAFSQIDF